MRLALAHLVLALVCSSSAAEASPQTIFMGVEPNETKVQATPAFDIQAGDWLQIAGNYYFTQPNFFRLRHYPAPLGIYRHQITDGGGPPLNFSATELLGREAVQDSVDARSSVVVQSTVASPGAPYAGYLAWYGFGKSEELYIDLRMHASTRPPAFFVAGARLSTTQVAAVDLGVVAGPALWFSAETIGAAHDLELHLFDAEFNALPRGSVDQTIYHPTDPWLHFDVAPGVYHIAVADHAAASHLPAGPHDLRLSTTVLDFAGAFFCASRATSFDLEVAVRSGPSGPTLASAVATKTLPYEVLWFRVQVDSGQASASFCPGDGSGGTCACYGPAPLNSGMGCVNSTGRGATAIATDHSALPGPRPWRITLEDLPPTTLALAFLSLQTNAATPVLAGLNCIGPGAVRVGPWPADLAGTATFDGYLPSTSGFLAGQTVHMQAAYRDFFAPSGCQLGFTSGFSFVVR